MEPGSSGCCSRDGERCRAGGQGAPGLNPGLAPGSSCCQGQDVALEGPSALLPLARSCFPSFRGWGG